MAGLTEKNKRAIDLYLSADESCQGNGTRCWQQIYGTKNAASAATAWQRMLRNVEAQVYLEQRQREIDAERVKHIAYDQAEALRDLLKIQQDSMEKVCIGKISNRIKAVNEKTGKETVKHEYEPVFGMKNASEARNATESALRVQGRHPDQKATGAGMMVSINMNFRWEGDDAQPVDVTPETQEEPPAQRPKLPPVVVIGKR